MPQIFFRSHAALALLAAGLVLPLPASAKETSETAQLRFEVLRNGNPFGTHLIRLKQQGDEVRVSIEIDLVAEIGPIPVFRYEHRNNEVWRDGRLISLDARTNNDGERLQVTAKAENGQIIVDGEEGRLTLPEDTIPSSYWNPSTRFRDRLLGTQRGRDLRVTIQPDGTNEVRAPGQEPHSKRYDIDGDLTLSVWYGPEDMLDNIAFKIRGQDISYRLVEADRDSFARILESIPANSRNAPTD